MGGYFVETDRRPSPRKPMPNYEIFHPKINPAQLCAYALFRSIKNVFR